LFLLIANLKKSVLETKKFGTSLCLAQCNLEYLDILDLNIANLNQNDLTAFMLWIQTYIMKYLGTLD